MDERRRYELYVVFQPELEDDALEARIDRVNGLLTSNSGEIVEVVRKGKRRLAYPINRYQHGIDVVYQANLPGPALETLERQFNLNEEIIRYLFVRRDDLDKAQRQARSLPAAEPTVTEEAASEGSTPAAEQPTYAEEGAADSSNESTPTDQQPDPEAPVAADAATDDTGDEA